MLIPKKFEIEFEKDRVFFFYYNKPLSQQRGHPTPAKICCYWKNEKDVY